MAEIPQFNPGSLPNLAVGTPGVSTAGQTFRNLASEIGQVRNQLGQARAGRNQAFLQPIQTQAAYAGLAIGKHLAGAKAKAAALQQSQIKALGQNTVADSTDKLGADADELVNRYKQQYVNNPSQAPTLLAGHLDELTTAYSDEIKDNPQFKNDPTYATKFKQKAADLKRASMRDINDWSLSRQTVNANASVDNVNAAAQQSVRDADGTPADKYGVYVAATKRVAQFATDKAPLLGTEQMAGKARNAMYDLGVELYQNIINDVPHDPMDRLQYLHNANGFLEKAQIPLPKGAMEQLHASINARTETATKLLVNQMKPAEDLHDIQIRQIGEGLRAVRFSPEAMNSARNFVATQQDALKAKLVQTQNDPALPDEAKHAVYGLISKQQGHLTSLLNTVNSQEDTMAATQRREAHELTAQNKQIASQQKAADTIAHGQAKDAALMDIYATSMEAGKYDPRTDSDKIQKIMENVTKKAVAAHAVGLISAEKFYAITNHSTAGAVHAANAEAQTPDPISQWAHGAFGLPIKLKPAKADQKAQARAAATKGMSDAVGGLQLVNRHHTLNTQAGMTGGEISLFDKKAQIDIARSQTENWQPGALDAQLNKRRQVIIAQRKAPASKHAGQYFVPPPPPNTPSVVPEYRASAGDTQ